MTGIIHTIFEQARDSVVSIMLTVPVEDRGFESRQGQDICFRIYETVQKGCAVHPASYFTECWGPFPEVKFPGRTANKSRPSNAEGKIERSLAIRLHGVNEENFFNQTIQLIWGQFQTKAVTGLV